MCVYQVGFERWDPSIDGKPAMELQINPTTGKIKIPDPLDHLKPVSPTPVRAMTYILWRHTDQKYPLSLSKAMIHFDSLQLSSPEKNCALKNRLRPDRKLVGGANKLSPNGHLPVWIRAINIPELSRALISLWAAPIRLTSQRSAWTKLRNNSYVFGDWRPDARWEHVESVTGCGRHGTACRKSVSNSNEYFWLFLRPLWSIRSASNFLQTAKTRTENWLDEARRGFSCRPLWFGFWRNGWFAPDVATGPTVTGRWSSPTDALTIND
jgi:hypothetical protein